MPKKTRLQKLRNQMRTVGSVEKIKIENVQSEFLSGDPLFKRDMMKSIFFAVFITVFEIALYFVYYLRVFERR